MFIALIVVVGLSLLILGHEAGHFFVAKLFGMKVEEFGFGFPPRMFSIKRGETEYSFNWLPFGGFVKITGENDSINGDVTELEELPTEEKKRFFFAQPWWRRVLVTSAGVFINFFIGWFLISLIFMVGTPPALVVGGIQAGSPAEKVGIKEGDVLKNYFKSADFINFVNQNRGHEIKIELQRDGKDLSLTAIPRLETKEGEGALGVLLSEAGMPREGFFASIKDGLTTSFEVSWLTLVGFYDIVKTLFVNHSLLPGVVGPVGIFTVAEQAGRIGLIYLFHLLALISLNLAVINVIPFPALDGGRVAMIIVEKIKGSPIPRKIEAFVNGAGFIFLILLIVLITIRDVAHLF